MFWWWALLFFAMVMCSGRFGQFALLSSARGGFCATNVGCLLVEDVAHVVKPLQAVECSCVMEIAPLLGNPPLGRAVTSVAVHRLRGGVLCRRCPGTLVVVSSVHGCRLDVETLLHACLLDSNMMWCHNFPFHTWVRAWAKAWMLRLQDLASVPTGPTWCLRLRASESSCLSCRSSTQTCRS